VSDPISRAAGSALPRTPLPRTTAIRSDLERSPSPAGATQPATGGRFADAMRAARAAAAPPAAATPSARSVGETALRASVQSIVRGERLVNGVISAARHGATFSNEQLIAIQAGVYKYTQELELASKLVDKATGAIRQTLQSQQ